MPVTGKKTPKRSVKRRFDVRFQQRRNQKAESREEDIRFTSVILSRLVVAFHCGSLEREFRLKAISDHTHMMNSTKHLLK